MAKKKLKVFILLGIIMLVVSALLLPGYSKLQDLIAENRRLEEKITELTGSIEDLRAEKERLENDMLYIEKVAREKLGVVRRDEVVIRQKKQGD